MSSRNSYLSKQEREAARCLYEALRAAVDAVLDGAVDAGAVVAAMHARVEAEPMAALDYAAVVDEDSFCEVDRLDGPTRAVIAARVGKPRLIDNVALPVGENVAQEVRG